MPFIARWPEKVKSGTTSKQLICFTDFLATFADIMGAKLPEKAGPDSFSFLPSLKGKPSPRDTFVMQAGSARTMMTIREDNWKLLTQLGSGGFSQPKLIKSKPGGPAGQLYDLTKDPGETTNLYQKHPDIVARLTKRLNEIKATSHRPLK